MGASEKVQSFALVEQPPELAFTRSGVAFNARADVWDWVDGPHRVRLDFGRIAHRFGSHCTSLKRCLAVFAKGYSAHYLTNLFDAFVHLTTTNANRAGLCPSITAEEVSAYLERLQSHEKWRIGTLNALLQKWSSLSIPGIEQRCVDYLRERRKPGNVKGNSVRTYDPEKGPFSASEYEMLYKAIDVAYGLGELPMWSIVLARLLFACGGRISQYASLKVMDFASETGVDGKRSYTLKLPQVKTGHAHARESFLVFDLSSQTGQLLAEYIAQLRNAEYEPQSAMFPDGLVYKGTPRTKRHDGDLFAEHCTAPALSSFFRNAIEPFAPLTDRLEYMPMPVHPRRFRYTFGTRMAEEGCSKAVIAERLGHVDLQNVDVYFEASPAIVENIDRAMDAFLAPVAQAFRGRLVEGEEQATFKGAAGTRIIDFRTSTSAIGSCGKGGGCSFNKPVACYTCFKFEPWLDAPHEKLLQRLLDERNRHANDARVAEVNDLAITAVREVIEECRQVREQRETGSRQ